jgi:hypothetical protein
MGITGADPEAFKTLVKKNIRTLVDILRDTIKQFCLEA